MARSDLLTRMGLRPPTPSGDPYYPPAEMMDTIIREFNAIEPTLTTDPVTGQQIYQKNMPKPMGPYNLDPAYQGYFMSPNNSAWNQNFPFLDATWIDNPIQGGAFSNMSAPTSDAMRQGGEIAGIGNVGAETTTLNPGSFRPMSKDTIPIRQSSIDNPYPGPEPIFHSLTDFTTNRVYTPGAPGAYSSEYTPFSGGVPGSSGSPPLPPNQPIDFENRLRSNLLRRSV